MSTPALPLRVTRILAMGGACPFQTDAVTDDGREVYVRYRGGRFRAYVAAAPGKSALGDDATLLVAESVGDPLDGSMEPEEMVRLTAGLIEWPKVLREEPWQEEDPRTPPAGPGEPHGTTEGGDQ